MDFGKYGTNNGDKIEDASDESFSSIKITDSKIELEFSTELSQNNPTFALDSNQSLSSPERENLNIPFPLSVHDSSISDMSFPSTNPLDFPPQHSPLLVEQIEAIQLDESSPRNSEPELQQNLKVPLPPESDQSSVSKESSSETSPPTNPPVSPTQHGPLMEACKSPDKNCEAQRLPNLIEFSPIITSDDARKLQSPEGGTSLDGEASTSTLQPSSEDSSNDDKPPSLQSGSSCGPIEPRSNRFPMYASKAKILLQSVLRELIDSNELADRRNELDLLFLEDSEFLRMRKESHQIKGVYNYVEGMDLFSKRCESEARDCTMVNFLALASQMLTTVVADILIFTLYVRLSGKFTGFEGLHNSLIGLYRMFTRYWENTDIESVKDKASRKNRIVLKEKIQRLLLVSLTAFTLILLYISENSTEDEQRKAKELLEDKKKILRETNRFSKFS